MSHVYCVFVVLHLQNEAESKELLAGLRCFFLTLVVTNVVAASKPADLAAGGFTLRVNQWTHTVVVQTIRLVHVDYVEFISLAFDRV